MPARTDADHCRSCGPSLSSTPSVHIQREAERFENGAPAAPRPLFTYEGEHQMLGGDTTLFYLAGFIDWDLNDFHSPRYYRNVAR